MSIAIEVVSLDDAEVEWLLDLSESAMLLVLLMLLLVDLIIRSVG